MNCLRKVIIVICFILCFTKNVYGEDEDKLVASTKNSSLTYFDMIEIFFECITKETTMFSHQRFVFDVFTEEEAYKHNIWVVFKNAGTEGNDCVVVYKLYFGGAYIVCQLVPMYSAIKAEFLGLKFFDSETEQDELSENLLETVCNAIKTGRKWQKRYKTDYSDREKSALKALLIKAADSANTTLEDEVFEELGLNNVIPWISGENMEQYSDEKPHF